MPPSSDQLRLLIYGPRLQKDPGDLIAVEHELFDIEFANLPSPVSFLDYHGVVVFGGAFIENVWPDPIGVRGPSYEVWADDLHRRQQESVSLIRRGGFLVLLVPPSTMAPHDNDLLPNTLHMLNIASYKMPATPAFDVEVREFQDYMERYGISVYQYEPRQDWSDFRAITNNPISAFVFADKVFVLPTVMRRSRAQLTKPWVGTGPG